MKDGLIIALAAMHLSGFAAEEEKVLSAGLQIRWIAQDADGRWYGYADKPSFSNATWMNTASNFIQLGAGKKAQSFATALYEI